VFTFILANPLKIHAQLR